MASRDRGRVRANDESAHRGYCRHQESKVAVDVSVAAIHCPVLSKQRWRILHAGRSTAWNAQSAPKTRRGPQPQNGRARTNAVVIAGSVVTKPSQDPDPLRASRTRRNGIYELRL